MNKVKGTLRLTSRKVFDAIKMGRKAGFCSLINWSGLVILIAISLSCAVNPVTQKREFMLLSQQDELALGKQTDAEIIGTYGVYQDEALSEYISLVGKKLVAVSHQPDLPFNFKIMDSSVVNAFAVPGGFVYVTRGILAYLNDEAELAGTMGHEIGHVTARHSAQLYTRAQAAQLGLALGSALSKTFQRFAGLAEAGLNVLFLSFSREHERQADDLGVLYASRAGYEASHMANLFVTLERLNPTSGQDGLPTWLSTHPDPPNRIEAVRKAAADWKATNPGAKLAVNRNEYLRKLDGLVFGDDPRQGYVEGQVFYHPGLKFQFVVPADWKLNNTASQVQIIAPKEDAAMVLTMVEQQTPEEAAKAFVDSNKATVLSSETKTLNGLETRRLKFILKTEEGNLAGLANFIKKDGQVMMFLGYTGDSKFVTYSDLISDSLNSFKPLTDQSKINVKPEKIKIIKTDRTDTLANILKPYNYNQERQKQIAIMNALELSDKVQTGTLLKILSK
ncbi:MAG TPA: M48 family metalloprotease [Candidatus Saccharicenans sp.]|nr:M48 family metalloprotease [Candidatus Saccharicenans sp.]